MHWVLLFVLAMDIYYDGDGIFFSDDSAVYWFDLITLEARKLASLLIADLAVDWLYRKLYIVHTGQVEFLFITLRCKRYSLVLDDGYRRNQILTFCESSSHNSRPLPPQYNPTPPWHWQGHEKPNFEGIPHHHCSKTSLRIWTLLV